ncbi:hypothetical protein [Methyloversatilis sp.]|uniref:hypothetical protein n=1 Tax=Methyloversatilis sp. TaxID=2569862 RepID=UPI0027B8A14B|nr:hypothetical protein [Methyloversatilis sp.]
MAECQSKGGTRQIKPIQIQIEISISNAGISTRSGNKQRRNSWFRAPRPVDYLSVMKAARSEPATSREQPEPQADLTLLERVCAWVALVCGLVLLWRTYGAGT